MNLPVSVFVADSCFGGNVHSKYMAARRQQANILMIMNASRAHNQKRFVQHLK